MLRGRLRKYSTSKARVEAKREYNRASYLRQKQQAAYPNFVPYAPAPPSVLAVTLLGVGLCISPDIAVPCD
ncbi:hypothetical protein CC86DRAFT_274362, partial [Ophiobolus disseminans]